MRVTLLVHQERLPESGRLVWWAESPEIPGFSSTDESLTDLRATSESAIAEILSEQGVDPAEVEFEVRIVGLEPVSHGEDPEGQTPSP